MRKIKKINLLLISSMIINNLMSPIVFATGQFDAVTPKTNTGLSGQAEKLVSNLPKKAMDFAGTYAIGSITGQIRDGQGSIQGSLLAGQAIEAYIPPPMVKVPFTYTNEANKLVTEQISVPVGSQNIDYSGLAKGAGAFDGNPIDDPAYMADDAIDTTGLGVGLLGGIPISDSASFTMVRRGVSAVMGIAYVTPKNPLVQDNVQYKVVAWATAPNVVVIPPFKMESESYDDVGKYNKSFQFTTIAFYKHKPPRFGSLTVTTNVKVNEFNKGLEGEADGSGSYDPSFTNTLPDGGTSGQDKYINTNAGDDVKWDTPIGDIDGFLNRFDPDTNIEVGIPKDPSTDVGNTDNPINTGDPFNPNTDINTNPVDNGNIGDINGNGDFPNTLPNTDIGGTIDPNNPFNNNNDNKGDLTDGFNTLPNDINGGGLFTDKIPSDTFNNNGNNGINGNGLNDFDVFKNDLDSKQNDPSFKNSLGDATDFAKDFLGLDNLSTNGNGNGAGIQEITLPDGTKGYGTINENGEFIPLDSKELPDGTKQFGSYDENGNFIPVDTNEGNGNSSTKAFNANNNSLLPNGIDSSNDNSLSGIFAGQGKNGDNSKNKSVSTVIQDMILGQGSLDANGRKNASNIGETDINSFLGVVQGVLNTDAINPEAIKKGNYFDRGSSYTDYTHPSIPAWDMNRITKILSSLKNNVRQQPIQNKVNTNNNGETVKQQGNSNIGSTTVNSKPQI